MSAARNWTWIDEREESDEAEDVHTEARRALKVKAIEALLSRWNMLEAQRERRAFDEQAQEYFAEYHGERSEERQWDARALACREAGKASGATRCCDTCYRASSLRAACERLSREQIEEIVDEARIAYDREVDAEEAKPGIEQSLIETQMAALGARLMRPYERWNEDERYMEYMENRSSYDDY